MKRRPLLKAIVGTTAVVAGCQQAPETETEKATDRRLTDDPIPPSVTSSSSTSTTTDDGETTDTAGQSKAISSEVLPDGIPEVPGGFDNVVNVIDAGADASGDEPINSVIEQAAGDDTLLVFPEGEYKLGLMSLEGLTNFGMVAARGARPRLVPAAPASEVGTGWLFFHKIDSFLIDGLVLDYRRNGYSGRVAVTPPGDFAVRNMDVLGRYDLECPMAFRFDVRSPDRSGLVENLNAYGVDHDLAETTGVYVGRLHAGELTFRDCNIENFPDNGLYASAPGGHGGSFEGRNGVVHVEGGLFRNNNISNVRLGSTGSTARGVSVVVDKTPPRHPNGLNVRGIRLRGKSGQVIENCDIEYTKNAGLGDGGIVLHRHNGRATVRNCRIRMNRDTMRAVWAENTDESVVGNDPGSNALVMENVRITGSARGGSAVKVVDRNETELRGCTISQLGANRDGIELQFSDNCVIEDTSVDVTGQPLILVQSNVDRSGFTTPTPAGSM